MLADSSIIIKANWDVAINCQSKRMRVGIILRDDNGVVIAYKQISKYGTSIPQVVETFGAYYDVEFCMEFELNKLTF